MTDSTLNRFWASGTNAERLAFTPDPPTPASGPDYAYGWYETDTNSFYVWDGAWNLVAGGVATKSITLSLSNGASDITTGAKGHIRVAEAGTITGWAISSLDTGDIEFDVFLDNSPGSTSIVAAAPPELVADSFEFSTTLTGWTTAVSAGQWIGFEVVSATGITNVNLQIFMSV